MNKTNQTQRKFISAQQAAKIKKHWNETSFTVEEISALLDVSIESVVATVNGRIHANVPPAPF